MKLIKDRYVRFLCAMPAIRRFFRSTEAFKSIFAFKNWRKRWRRKSKIEKSNFILFTWKNAWARKNNITSEAQTWPHRLSRAFFCSVRKVSCLNGINVKDYEELRKLPVSWKVESRFRMLFTFIVRGFSPFASQLKFSFSLLRKIFPQYTFLYILLNISTKSFGMKKKRTKQFST